jgi:hypothetical protein
MEKVRRGLKETLLKTATFRFVCGLARKCQHVKRLAVSCDERTGLPNAARGRKFRTRPFPAGSCEWIPGHADQRSGMKPITIPGDDDQNLVGTGMEYWRSAAGRISGADLLH